jgi:hypothetical protein
VHAGDSSVVCSRDGSGALVARTGVPLADAYLEFLARPVPDQWHRQSRPRPRLIRPQDDRMKVAGKTSLGVPLKA